MLTPRDAYHNIMAQGHTIKRTIKRPIEQAIGYVLACPCPALYTQPAYAVSAMDGYAVCGDGVNGTYQVIGEAAAGHPFNNAVNAGEAVRIFTGAIVPKGADRIIIQENVRRTQQHIEVLENAKDGAFIRAKGGDFIKNTFVLAQHTVIKANHIGLLAMMGYSEVLVYDKPKVAILSSGDEMRFINDKSCDSHVIASNSYALKAQVEQYGGEAHLLGIAKDTVESIYSHCSDIEQYDILITSGGASVGDYDLMHVAMQQLGINLLFEKVAMRPGKPFLFGTKNKSYYMGFAGNPISSFIAAYIFLQPLLRQLSHKNDYYFIDDKAQSQPLNTPLQANSARQEYARALWQHNSVSVHGSQDSSLLSNLASANALIIRPPHDKAKKQHDMVQTILL